MNNIEIFFFFRLGHMHATLLTTNFTFNWNFNLFSLYSSCQGYRILLDAYHVQVMTASSLNCIYLNPSITSKLKKLAINHTNTVEKKGKFLRHRTVSIPITFWKLQVKGKLFVCSHYWTDRNQFLTCKHHSLVCKSLIMKYSFFS